MFYSVFFKIKNEDEVKKIVNYSTKDELLKEVYLPYINEGKFNFNGVEVTKDEIEFFKVIETGLQAPEDYENIKRYIKETKQLGEKFLNEKFPNYYAKDITKEL